MQVRDGLAAVRAVIDYEAEAFGEIEFAGNLAGDGEHMAEDGFVSWSGFSDARDNFLRDDEQVHRRLRLDVVEDEALIVLVFDLGGDFSGDDAFEDGLGHGRQI